MLRSGLHPSDIITGYEIALEKVQELLKSVVAKNVENIEDPICVKIIESVLAPNMPNHYKFFGKLIYDACRSITRDVSPRFNEDSLRVCKILGASTEDSMMVKGFVINRGFETRGKEKLEKAKVVVYRCPF